MEAPAAAASPPPRPQQSASLRRYAAIRRPRCRRRAPMTACRSWPSAPPEGDRARLRLHVRGGTSDQFPRPVLILFVRCLGLWLLGNVPLHDLELRRHPRDAVRARSVTRGQVLFSCSPTALARARAALLAAVVALGRVSSGRHEWNSNEGVVKATVLVVYIVAGGWCGRSAGAAATERGAEPGRRDQTSAKA